MENNGLQIGSPNVATLNNTATANITLNLPILSVNDTLVSRTSTDTLQNKTIEGGVTGNDITANRLATTGTAVNVLAAPPLTGQVLTAITPTVAQWNFVNNLFADTILSARNPSNLTGDVQPLVNWTEDIDNGNNFNPTTGIYTVPTNGIYEITLVVNFATTVTINISNETPGFYIRQQSPGDVILARSGVSLVDITVLAVNIRALVGRGQVIISNIFELIQGNEISTEADFAGLLGINITLSAVNYDTTIYIRKISDPI